MEGKNLSENLKSWGILGFVVLGIVLMLSGSVNAYNNLGNGVCECNSCSDCTNALNDNVNCSKEVRLIADIINQSGTCIYNPQNFNNKIFDCQGHIIDGNYTGTGIRLNGKFNNTIKNCVITDFSTGIYLDSSSHNTLTNNTANNNSGGIYLRYSSNYNTLTNNTANNNHYYGIYLGSSSNTIMRNNTMKNNTYNFAIYGYEPDFYQDIDISNLVDNKPIYYWTNKKNAPNGCKNAEINGSTNAGFVALISCDNITVKNLNLTKNSHGILLVNTINSEILNNTANNNRDGIYLYYSPNNIITNNTANNNYDDEYYSCNSGIYLDSSSYNTMTNNIANNNKCYGIYLDSSSYNTMTNNIANNNRYGILLYSSLNNILTNNTANNNHRIGIYLDSSSHNILTNNTANNNSDGIYLEYSSNDNTIVNSTANNNKYGIYLYSSNFNQILGNKISNNNETGIAISNCDLWGSFCGAGNSDNSIEGNEILNNKIGIFSRGSDSIINNNYVCGNNQSDFYSTNWLSSSGDNNTCNKSDSWNDTGTTGCKYKCPKCKTPKDIFDAAEMLEHLSLHGQENSSNSSYCDLNNDGVINLLDVLELMGRII